MKTIFKKLLNLNFTLNIHFFTLLICIFFFSIAIMFYNKGYENGKNEIHPSIKRMYKIN